MCKSGLVNVPLTHALSYVADLTAELALQLPLPVAVTFGTAARCAARVNVNYYDGCESSIASRRTHPRARRLELRLPQRGKEQDARPAGGAGDRAMCTCRHRINEVRAQRRGDLPRHNRTLRTHVCVTRVLLLCYDTINITRCR